MHNLPNMHLANKLNKMYRFGLVLSLPLLLGRSAFAQVSSYDEDKRGSVYVLVGSNTPTFGTSDIHITQGTTGLKSDYTLKGVEADNKTTSKSSGLAMNLKVGYFFDYNQNWAVELSYEPVKYHLTDGQTVQVSGVIDNATVNTTMLFASSKGYFYNIDGTNLLSVNLVRRFQLLQNKKHTLRLDALLKAGGGPAMPHVYNSFNSKTAEYPSFQFGGWNVGGEAALRVTLFRYVFVEGGYKYSHVSYTDIGVYNGTATQTLRVSQILIGGGITFPTTKRNPLFTKPDLSRPPLTIKPIYPEPVGLDDGIPTDEAAPEAAPAPAKEDAPAPPDDLPVPPPEDPGQ